MSAVNTIIWEGDAFRPAESVPVGDRGFRYGMAFFESLAIRNGRVERLDAHLQRLQQAAAFAGWVVPEAAWEAVGPALEGLFLPGPVFARIYLTAGDGGPLDAVNAPRLICTGEPRADVISESIGLSPVAMPYLPLAGGFKTANYWANIQALAEAKRAGADEALLFNPKGELVSAAMANVFLLIDGEWQTPPVETGARRGVVRDWLLDMARERFLRAEDLARVEQAFLTSSWNGVVPIHRIGMRELEVSREVLELQACFRDG